MKATINGINVEGTPDEIVQYIMRMQEQNKPTYPHKYVPKTSGDAWWLNLHPSQSWDQKWREYWKANANTTGNWSYLAASNQLTSYLTKMTPAQQKSYMDAWANDPD